MAYTLDIVIPAGITGLTDLRAQLFDASGNVGSAVSTGFTERGTSGNYLWHYTAWPDGFRGGVEFYSAADASTILAVAGINPEEAEHTDTKTSTRLASVSYTAPDNATITTMAANVVSILADTGTDGVALSVTVKQSIADTVLGRSVSNAEGSAGLHSLVELILAILESSTATGSWVINKTDGATAFNTRTLVTSSSAQPIVGVS